MGIYAILIAGPRLSNMVPPFAAFLINIVCIMLLMIMGCHNVIMYNHSTFALGILSKFMTNIALDTINVSLIYHLFLAELILNS